MRRFIRRLRVVEVRRVHGLIATLLAVATLTGVSTRTARHLPTDSSIGQAEDAAHADAPTVWFTVTTPTSSATQSITIHWCDDVSMVPNSRYFTVNGGVVSTDYTVGSDPGCTAYATSTVTVNLNLGSNALYAKIRGDNFEWGEATDVIVRENPPPPTYGVTVTPDGAEASVPFSMGQTQWFKLKNTGNQSTTFQVSATCFGAGIASGCTLSNSSKLVTGGATDSVSVSYTSGAVGTKGRIDIVADSGGVMDEAYVTVLPYGTSASNYPIVDLSNSHPGTTVERGDCLTISLGASAAYECGDVRFVHALPTVTTLSKARTPTMLFNSAHNRPTPVVAADVSLPSASGTPDSTVAKLTVDAALVATGSWPGAPWAGGASRRIGLSYSATTTGIKSFSLEVAFFIGGVRYATTKTGELAVVDRRSSTFGSGWWLAGLEQLQVVGNRVLWIGGDGSTRVYVDAGLVPSTGTRRWVAPAYDRPDSMFHDTTSGNYTRNLPGGLRVVFNGSGQHVSTVNRLNQTTSFAYSGGMLTTITVPPSSAATAYQFSYTGSNRLSSVAVRGPTGGSTRTTTVTDSAGLIKSILDPGDSVPVRFTFVSPSNANVLARKDRTGHSTVFGYDSLNRVTLVADTVGVAVLRDTLAAAETRGQPGVASVRSDSVVSRHNGPRDDAIDAMDVTTFAIDRHGAPALIRNALGYVTKIERGDIRWPGLATRVRSPNGRSVVALHDMRGNLRSTTDSSTVQGTKYAVTRFQWDAKWDAVTKITEPTGLVTEMSYDATLGTRMWRQDRRGTTSRVNFAYETTGIAVGLLIGATPPGGVRDTIGYDATQGNIQRLATARGFRTSFERDSIGRVITTRRQIDTATAVGTLAQQDSATYDLRDLVTRSIVYGPTLNSVAAQKVVVENQYDGERRPTLVRRMSSPDSESIGWISTSWTYDAIGRRVTELAGDGKADSTFYNPAGMADSVRTRRGHKLRYWYDAVGQMTGRKVDSVVYPARIAGVAAWSLVTSINTPYPRYLKNGSGGMTVPKDSAAFTYDDMGNILTAENTDARVSKTWAQNGTLSTETLKVQTYARDDWTKHVYTTNYYYDLGARPVRIKYPAQFAVFAGDSVNFAYDTLSGLLGQVTDLQRNAFEYLFNARNELITRRVPGAALSDSYEYDADGGLRVHVTRDSTTGTTAEYHPNYEIRRDSVAYDARGKVLKSKNVVGVQNQVTATYSGLGHLVKNVSSELYGGVSVVVTDFFDYDALGNVRRDSSYWSGITQDYWSQTYRGTNKNYSSNGTGRLTVDDLGPDRVDAFTYDAAGNTEFVTWSWLRPFSGAWADDRASFYDALGRLVAVDRRVAQEGANYDALFNYNFTFEEHRYDALGRRILVRSQRACDNTGSSTDCALSLVRRTVWAGSQEIAEIQMPGHPGTSATVLENDTDTIPTMPTSWGDSPVDQNSWYGRVAYAFAGAIDQPISVTRYNFVDSLQYWGVLRPKKTWAPFTMIPHWNWRGNADNGSFADGAGGMIDGVREMCTGSGSTLRCIKLLFPYGMSSYARNAQRQANWQGTLTEGKRDQTGALYRRNRYFDPATARFTQQDPIGLAGGLNVYGYAGGDPINFSDPFGLHVTIRSATGAAARDRLLEASPTFARLFNALHGASRNNVNLTLRLAADANEMQIANSMDFGAFSERTPSSPDGRIIYNSEATVGHMASMLSHEIIHSAGQYSEFTGVGSACGKKVGSHQSECFRALDAKISAELAAYWKNNPGQASADRKPARP